MKAKRWIRELILENHSLRERERKGAAEAAGTVYALRRQVEDLEASLEAMAPQSDEDRIRTVDADDWNVLVEKLRASVHLRTAIRMVIDDIEKASGG